MKTIRIIVDNAINEESPLWLRFQKRLGDCPAELTLKLTHGLSEMDLKAFRTRRRRIRSYFGSAANLSNVAMTIDASMVKNKALCGYVVKIAGHTGVKGLRASEGYRVMNAPACGPAHPVIHALCASFYLHLDRVPTELFIIPKESLSLCKTLMSGALQEMLRHIPRLKGQIILTKIILSLVRFVNLWLENLAVNYDKEKASRTSG